MLQWTPLLTNNGKKAALLGVALFDDLIELEVHLVLEDEEVAVVVEVIHHRRHSYAEASSCHYKQRQPRRPPLRCRS